MAVLNLSVLAVLFVFLLPRSASGAVFCVTNSTELQNALNTARSNGEDDTIQVVQGTYSGNFSYIAFPAENFSLTLEGGYTPGCASRVVDPANTILDGGGAGSVLTFLVFAGNTGASLTMDGFTIRNGGGIGAGFPGSIILTNNHIHDNSRGVVVRGEPITLTNNTISNNLGGGVSADSDSSITLTDNTIDNNSGGLRGAGINATTNGGSIILTNNRIRNNSEEGGVFVNAPFIPIPPFRIGSITLTGNIISGNSGVSSVGGVFAEGGSITLSNNTISSNTNNEWGAGVFARGSPITLADNTISGNTISGFGSGGGIAVIGISVTLINNTISGNSNNNGRGGGIAAVEGGLLTLTNNTISGNRGVVGGGIFAQVSSSTFTNNTVTRNTATSDGGGLFSSLRGDSATADVYNNIIFGNIAGRLGDDIFNEGDADNNGVEFP